ncbi:hypothetical protein ACOSB0_00430, partial [Candidatus Phytoplasma citri]
FSYVFSSDLYHFFIYSSNINSNFPWIAIAIVGKQKKKKKEKKKKKKKKKKKIKKKNNPGWLIF